MTRAVSYLWPYPPSVNALYRRAPQGGMFKTAKWKSWRVDTMKFMRAQGAEVCEFDGPVKVEYIVARPDRRRRDVTNLIKALDDMLEELGVVSNDCQIVDCRIAWDTKDRVANGLMVHVETAGIRQRVTP
jgi:crossover junction endodeoxyribonuclease RusA